MYLFLQTGHSVVTCTGCQGDIQVYRREEYPRYIPRRHRHGTAEEPVLQVTVYITLLVSECLLQIIQNGLLTVMFC